MVIWNKLKIWLLRVLLIYKKWIKIWKKNLVNILIIRKNKKILNEFDKHWKFNKIRKKNRFKKKLKSKFKNENIIIDHK